MGLKGQLEDLPLIDMLQIIAFSQKSGYLRIAGPAGRGAVIVKEGRILFAFSWSTMDRLRELAHDPDKISVDANRQNIEAALRELAGLREGSFKFELTNDISDELGGVRIKPFMIPGGVDPQEVLLDLAVEIDNERRQASTLLELAFQGDPPAEEEAALEEDRALHEALPPDPTPEPPATPPAAPSDAPPPADPTVLLNEPPAAQTRSAHTVVLVDDEAPVTDIVGEELRARGYSVVTADGPDDGAQMVSRHIANGASVLVAVDLRMPTTSGQSFDGGFELIGRIQRDHATVPILLMVEALGPEERDRAKTLGIRRIAYKPTLTKPDPALYASDLRAFTTTIDNLLQKLSGDQNGAADAPTGAIAAPADDGERVEFLSQKTQELVAPGGSADVSRLVLEVAAKFVERGVLFVIKSDTARGLAGFGFGRHQEDCNALSRTLAIPLESSKLLTEVVSTGKSHRATDKLQSLESNMLSEIGRANASEGILVPMLYNRATLLLLYGDNGVSGSKIGELGGLELFMAQAGMALENKLLQRKLQSGEHATTENMEQGA